MKCLSMFKSVLLVCVTAVLLPLTVRGEDKWPPADSYLPSTETMIKQKASYDDQKDLLKTFHPKDVLPPEIWNQMHWDIAEMKKETAEIYGFTAPELTGKIAPEIKPGHYTCKDLEKYPGLKKLFTPVLLKTVKAGGPPFVCSIMDFELQPTKQMHMSLPICKMTLKNMGKAKLDKDGYIVPRSWQGGVPFPRPSGKFKAQQVYYNLEKRSTSWDTCYRLTGEGLAFNKNLKEDKYNKYVRNIMKLMGRSFLPPFGWFDKRAERRGEFQADAVQILEPRANRGLVTMLLRYDDPNKMDPMMIYLPQLRRIRKMSSTDTQDPNGDAAYDDMGFIRQKITPRRFPYKFDIIGEREYLLPMAYNNAKAWIDKEHGYAIRDLGLMRRPVYVLQMTQLDSSYIYSKRIYYVDRETWQPAWAEFYDQKGRLYRTYNVTFCFIPECGQSVPHGLPAWQVDHIDTHSSFQVLTELPANFSRRDFNMENMIRKGK